MVTPRRAPHERVYVDRLSRSVNRILLDVLRCLWAALQTTVAGVAMTALSELASGTLWVYRGKRRVKRRVMVRLCRWAREQHTKVTSGSKLKHDLDGIVRHRGQAAGFRDGAKPMLNSELTRPTRVVSFSRALKSTTFDVQKSNEGGGSSRRLTSRSVMEAPIVDPLLVRCPSVPASWRSRHMWFTDRVSRSRRCRGEELDYLFEGVRDVITARGWARIELPARASLLIDEMDEPDGEQVLSYNLCKPKYISDRIYRISSKHLYCLQMRMRVVYPEELSLLYEWPVDSPILTTLSKLGVPSSLVLKMLSWGVHGATERQIASLVHFVCDSMGEEKRVAFYCCGVNTMAAIFNEVFGAGKWVYEAAFEANPWVFRLHRAIWGEVVRHCLERAEAPPTVRLDYNTAIATNRCQPFCYLNLKKMEQLPGALDERFAIYEQISKQQPLLVVDEMLGRDRMGSLAEAWEHAEFLREYWFTGYRFYILVTDPGCRKGGWVNSYREIVFGVRSDVKADVKAWLTANGYRPSSPRVWKKVELGGRS